MMDQNKSQQGTGLEATESEGEILTLMRAGKFLFAVRADDIATVIEWRQPVPLPRAPEPVLGIVAVQGRMLTLVDPLFLLAAKTSPKTERKILALKGDEQLALAIESVDAEIEVNPATFTPAPGAAKIFSGMVEVNGHQVPLLEVEKIFPAVLHGRERRRRRF